MPRFILLSYYFSTAAIEDFKKQLKQEIICAFLHFHSLWTAVQYFSQKRLKFLSQKNALGCFLCSFT